MRQWDKPVFKREKTILSLISAQASSATCSDLTNPASLILYHILIAVTTLTLQLKA